MHSSLALLSRAAHARSIMPIMAVLCPTYPRIQELSDSSTLPRSHHPDQLFTYTVATKHTPDKPNHPSSIHCNTSLAEDMNIELVIYDLQTCS
jgi:hypothetical protein